MRRALVLGLPLTLSCCMVTGSFKAHRGLSDVSDVRVSFGAVSLEGSDETEMDAEGLVVSYKNEKLRLLVGKLAGEFDSSKALRLRVKMGAAELEDIPRLELELKMGAAEVGELREGRLKVKKGAVFVELAEGFSWLKLRAQGSAVGILVPKGRKARVRVEGTGSEIEVDSSFVAEADTLPLIEVEASDSKVVISSDKDKIKEKVSVDIEVD